MPAALFHSARSWIIAAFALVVAAWASVAIAAEPADVPWKDAVILTPKPPAAPRINGAKIFGVRPGRPFLYTIPATGMRPIEYSVDNLPEGLKVDPKTGQITGTIQQPGTHLVVFRAKNAEGEAERPFKIVCGDMLALTPPMGWNDWYAHYNRITDKMMREAARAMAENGMAAVGYQYVSIDDCWMNAPSLSQYQTDSKRVGPLRDAQGNIKPNVFFPDMKALTDYIHSLGLKAGIYTSPGPLTCAGFAGSWQHEAQDARQFADWGFDMLKYDWCSYGKVVGGRKDLETLKRPYKLMGDLLKQQNRDILLNLCQYGMGNVWQWGAEVGGQSWRTGGDLGCELNRIFEVALKNAEYREYSKPGSWNDPDYLQIGYIGNAHRMGKPVPCRLTANEQYSFMSLWCLMAAPLFYSGDMTRLDPFTLGVLCNPEVIEVDQDSLGECGRVVHLPNRTFLMVKRLDDGNLAVGLFNRGENEDEVTAKWSDLGLTGKQVVRDLWRQKDLGEFDGAFSSTVGGRGVVLIRVGNDL